MIEHEGRICPGCKTVLDASAGLEYDVPVVEEGDISICFCCATILQFTATGFRIIPDDELAEYPRAMFDRLKRVQQAVAEFHDSEGGN